MYCEYSKTFHLLLLSRNALNLWVTVFKSMAGNIIAKNILDKSCLLFSGSYNLNLLVCPQLQLAQFPGFFYTSDSYQ